MKTRQIRILLVGVLGIIFSMSFDGCKKSEKLSPEQVNKNVAEINREILKQPQTVVTLAALKFLKQLKQEGRLPGTPADEAGMFRSEKRPELMTSGPSYSFKEIHYFTTAGPARNRFYVVEQVSSNSPPQLVKAWAADEAGNIVQTYSVQ